LQSIGQKVNLLISHTDISANLSPFIFFTIFLKKHLQFPK